MKRALVLFLALAATALAPFVASADDLNGKQLYLTRTCVACHGKGGAKAIQTYPHLAGLPEAYLYEQMKDIAAGARVSGPDARGYPRTQAMKDVMGIVTDDELKAIAAWLAAQPPPPVVAGDAAKIALGAEAYLKGGCVACHGKGGAKPTQGYPIVAGQKKDYLLLQIKEIHDGVRTNSRSKLMTAMIKRVTDADIETIAEYLSSTERAASQ
jgi:cytochrome c553